MKGNIFDIKRFAAHDGEGIRTTLFLKGCPLKCKWCHNPEGISFDPILSCNPSACTNCGECARVCNAHTMKDGVHFFDRGLCTACGKCESVCPGNALRLYGKSVEAAEILPVLLEDKDFYEETNGGVTLSGGECLSQAEFCCELLKMLKENNIHTAVDTSGFVDKKALDLVMPYTDIFLYDLKAIDDDIHIACTGHSNKKILDNLKYLDSCGKKIEIRVPLVPEMNESELDKINEFAQKLENVTKVKILKYHDYAENKYTLLGMEYEMK